MGDARIWKINIRQCLPDLIEPVYVARMVLFLNQMMQRCDINNYIVEDIHFYIKILIPAATLLYKLV